MLKLFVHKQEVPVTLTRFPAKGLLRVEKIGDDFVLFDQQTRQQELQGALKLVFEDGKLYNEQTLEQIRKVLHG